MRDIQKVAFDDGGYQEKPTPPTEEEINREIFILKKDIVVLENQIKQYQEALGKINQAKEKLTNARQNISDAEIELYYTYSKKIKIVVATNLLNECDKIDQILNRYNVILQQIESKIEQLKQTKSSKEMRLRILTTGTICW